MSNMTRMQIEILDIGNELLCGRAWVPLDRVRSLHVAESPVHLERRSRVERDGPPPSVA